LIFGGNHRDRTARCGGEKAKAAKTEIWLPFLNICKIEHLPPYSPDLNPIEQAFAKLKALLRKAAERSIAALWDRIGALLSAFTPPECANYFRHAGYASA
jgi:transposase